MRSPRDIRSFVEEFHRTKSAEVTRHPGTLTLVLRSAPWTIEIGVGREENATATLVRHAND